MIEIYHIMLDKKMKAQPVLSAEEFIVLYVSLAETVILS